MARDSSQNLTCVQRTLIRAFFWENPNRTTPTAGESFGTTSEPGPSGNGPKSITRKRENNRDPNSQFELCDFRTSPSWCLIGWAAPLVLVHAIAERTKNALQGKTILMWFAYWVLWNFFGCLFTFIALWIDGIFGLVVFLILLAGYCVLGMIYVIQVARLKIQTRQRYGIAGDECMDYATSFICCVTQLNCNICQMFYEVHSREGVEIV